MSHRHLFVKLLISAGFCLSSSAAAQIPWHLHYEEGVRALQSNNYTDAVESLRMALAANRAPASRIKLYGTRYIPYYPWFYLGKAYYELAERGTEEATKNYQQSVEAFDVSMEHGEIDNEVALGAEIRALRENAIARIEALRQTGEAMRYMAAGKERFAAGELQLAYEEFLKADALLRDDPEVRSQIVATRDAIDERWRLEKIQQSRQALDDGQPDEAKKLAQEVLARFPADTQADQLLSSVARRQAEAIERRLQSEADEARALIREREDRLNALSQVQAALANGRFDEARRLNARVLENDPRDEEARLLDERIVAAELSQREDERAANFLQEGQALFESEQWLEAIRALSQIPRAHYRSSDALNLIERAERELNRMLVTFDSPAENERIRGEDVIIRGRAVASAGLRRVSVTVNGEAVHSLFVLDPEVEAPDALDLNQTIQLGEGRNVLVLEAEDTLGRRETLSARSVRVFLPFYRRPLPMAVTSLSLLVFGFGAYIVIKYRRDALMRRNMEVLERAVRTRTEELVAAQHQLVQSEKMATLGRVASSVAHEINSPLGVITSNKQIYESIWRKLNQTEAGDSSLIMKVFQSTLENDRVAVDRIEQQVTNLRRFASLDEAEVKRTAVDEILDTALAMLEERIASRAVTISRLPDPKRTQRVYRAADLSQVFHGVLEFCLDHVASHQRLTIKTSASSDPSTLVEIETVFDAPIPEPLEDVFEPHFRERSGRIGADMSLTLSRHLVQDAGGRLNLECVDETAKLYRFTFDLREVA